MTQEVHDDMEDVETHGLLSSCSTGSSRLWHLESAQISQDLGSRLSMFQSIDSFFFVLMSSLPKRSFEKLCSCSYTEVGILKMLFHKFK